MSDGDSKFKAVFNPIFGEPIVVPATKKAFSSDDECPEDCCMYCWEQGKSVQADDENNPELCSECEQERQIGRADALYDMWKEDGHE